ncbi:hypothetical protein [Kallotenue papyrolyticum]|uniref:hypothetical protein n=1 Tax=Kallotenue papyrolyticum TaxID=1325125 RepID=UPI000492478A|nr:hypothetical protein [Kallotenue papyrolyticum]
MEAYIQAILRHATYDIDSDGSTFGAIDIAPELAVSAAGATRAQCTAALERALYQCVRAALQAQRHLPSIDGILPPTDNHEQVSGATRHTS